MLPTKSYRTSILPLLLAALSAAGTASGQSSEQDPISQLNGAFRSAYARARTHTLDQIGPIIVASGDRLVLLHDGRRIEGTTVHRNYHDLKTVAHVPLAIYVLLAPYDEGPIDTDGIAQLRQLRQLTAAARKALAQTIPDERLARRQRRFLRKCLDYLDARIEGKKYSRQGLSDFLVPLADPIRDNIRAAVKLRIDNYHAQALAWRSSMPADEWARLKVVVPGAALPRTNSLTVQYFAKLLGERGEGRRIVYAESVFTESQALRLLGTHLLDTQIGADFFSDPWRMHRDLLGTAAADYLERLEFDAQ